MRVFTKVKGPSLADVIAFSTIESPEDVARVERSAADRMAAVRGWYGWQVESTEFSEIEDGLSRLAVHAAPVGGGYRPAPVTFVFLDDGKTRRSERLDAFLKACGCIERVDDDREILGRFFATKNRGRAAGDFGPLTRALVAN